MPHNSFARFRRWPPLVIAVAAFAVGIALHAANVQPPLVVGQLRDGIPEMSEQADARVLAADIAESYTVPTYAQEPGVRVPLSFSATCADWYLRRGGTAAVPAADVSNGTASIRSPSRRMFEQGDVLSMIAPTDCTITIERGQSRG